MKLGIFLRNEMMCLLTNIQVSYDDVIFEYTVTDRIMEKKRFNLQAPPVYDIKVTNLFFFHNYCFHNYFFSIILSVTVCPSIRNLNAF